NEDIALKGANCYFGELSYEMSHAGCYENVKLHVKLDSRTGTYPKLIIRMPLPGNESVISADITYGDRKAKEPACLDLKGMKTKDIVIEDFDGEITADIVIHEIKTIKLKK
ncbi:MAG: hypothetical protein ACYCYI_08470, partial [Saccharofermentanales bacterium]